MNTSSLLSELLTQRVYLLENLLRALPAVTIILLVMVIVQTSRHWLQKSKASANQAGQSSKNLTNIYERIHNYQHQQPTQPLRTPTTAHNNGSTDSNYHHAIKLLQRGMDTQTLIEYCNLTQAEAELLQAVYGNKTN